MNELLLPLKREGSQLKGAIVSTKYLNIKERKLVPWSVVGIMIAIAVMAGALTDTPSASSPSTNRATASRTLTVDEIRLAVERATHQSPDYPRFHGRSAAYRAQPGPTIIMRPQTAGSIPGVRKMTFILNKSQTAEAKKKVMQYEARGGVAVAGAAAATCAVIFIEGTPLASAIGAAVCATLISFWWADIVDTMNQVKGRKRCFAITGNLLPIFNAFWLDFAAVRCPRGYNK